MLTNTYICTYTIRVCSSIASDVERDRGRKNEERREGEVGPLTNIDVDYNAISPTGSHAALVHCDQIGACYLSPYVAKKVANLDTLVPPYFASAALA